LRQTDIWLNDPELIHIAKTEHSFIMTQVDITSTFGAYGASNDMELTMRNLCTQVIWVAQRSDRDALNDYDNYTNWEDPFKPPLDSSGYLSLRHSTLQGMPYLQTHLGAIF